MTFSEQKTEIHNGLGITLNDVITLGYLLKTKRITLHCQQQFTPGENKIKYPRVVNPFRPEFTFVIFIHYKTRIAVAIYDL